MHNTNTQNIQHYQKYKSYKNADKNITSETKTSKFRNLRAGKMLKVSRSSFPPALDKNRSVLNCLPFPKLSMWLKLRQKNITL